MLSASLPRVRLQHLQPQTSARSHLVSPKTVMPWVNEDALNPSSRPLAEAIIKHQDDANTIYPQTV